MLQQGGVKIWRPRQLYVGSGLRDYVPIDERKDKSKEALGAGPTPVEHIFSKRMLLSRAAKL